MKTFLRTCCWLLGLLTGTWSAQASHLLGGEIVYRYLDMAGPANKPFRYEVKALVYLNGEPGSAFPFGRNSVNLVIEDLTTNAVLLQATAPQTHLSDVTARNGNCAGLASQPPQVALATYTLVVNLPFAGRGYRAVLAETARNNGITNLVNSGQTNMVLSTVMAPPALPNTSPVFSDTAVVLVCRGDTSVTLNNAYDADGDRLRYAFGRPSVTYATGYSLAQPFGRNGYAAIDSSTGLSRYLVPQQGRFVVAVDVSEYRTVNGTEVLLGSTRRDIQLVSRVCPPNQAPVFSGPTLAVRDFAIAPGEPLAFNLQASDPDGQPLTMRVSSNLLDGAGPLNATFNNSPGVLPPGGAIGRASATGTGSVSGTFRYTPDCGVGRTTVHDVVVTVTDGACASKTVAAVFRITVNRTVVPGNIVGDSLVCAENPGIYTVVNGPAATYRWTVRGGQIQGAATGRSVQVLWGSGPAGAVTARPVGNCPADSVTRAIVVVPSNFVVLGPNPPICPGATAELSASGAQAYTWTGGGMSGNGPRFRVAPTQTTTYILQARNGNCTSSQYVTVTVSPLEISGPRIFCPESRTGIAYSATSFPGAQYQWSISGGRITAGQGSSSIRADLPAGVATATLQVSTSTGCNATFTLRADNARPVLEAASVQPGADDRSVQLALRVPDAAATTSSLSVWRRPAGSGAFQLIGTTDNAGAAFTDSNAETDTQAYDYRLELRNGCGTLLASEEHTTILAQAAILQEPQGRTQGRAAISWTGYRGFPVQAYRVFREVDGRPAELVATLPGTARRAELSTSNLGFDQCFRVQAQRAADATQFVFSNAACLRVANKLAFYNVITPNGDGLNDALLIDNVALYPGNTLTVYNRWGREVYHARDYANTYAGEPGSAGLYYYLFGHADGTVVKGWFEVVR